MAIIEDTRQQAGKHEHVKRWMDSHGVEFHQRARALPFGDYITPGGNISVDTKKDLVEVAGNLGKGHARFTRELVRATEQGWRLIILIEQYPAFNDRAKLYKWRNPHGRLHGPTLAKMMNTMEENYSIRFEFCAKRDTARRICEILGVSWDEDSKG